MHAPHEREKGEPGAPGVPSPVDAVGDIQGQPGVPQAARPMKNLRMVRERSGGARSKADATMEELRRLTLRVTALQVRIRSIDDRLSVPYASDPALEKLAEERASRDLPPLPHALVWFDLYCDIKRFLDTSSVLLYLYERVPQSHRRAPNIADVLARMWSTGVEFPLSRMDTATATATTQDEAFTLSDACSNTLYYTYSLFSSILEGTTSRAVRRACIEWLGSIAAQLAVMLHHSFFGSMRGRSTLRAVSLPSDALDMYECGAWRAAALHWRGTAVRESPQHGVLYAALASVDCDHPLNTLYWYCKSMQVARPYFGACAAATDIAGRVTQAEAPEDLYIFIQGMLLRGSFDVDDACARLARALYDGEPLCETQWMRMALCCVAALLEYGSASAFISIRLLAAHLVPAKDRRASHEFPQAAAALDSPANVTPAVFPEPTAAALELMLMLVDAAAASLDADSDIGTPSAAFLIIVFSFIHAVSLRSQPQMVALQTAVRARVPWRAIARVAHSLIARGYSPPQDDDLPRLASNELPEDWVLHGTSWALTGPWYFGGADVGHADPSVGGAHVSTWGYLESNEADMFAARDTTAGRRCLMRQPLQAQLHDEVHLRDVRCARLYLVSSITYYLLGKSLDAEPGADEDGEAEAEDGDAEEDGEADGDGEAPAAMDDASSSAVSLTSPADASPSAAQQAAQNGEYYSAVPG